MTPNLPKEVMCNMDKIKIPLPPALPNGLLIRDHGAAPSRNSKTRVSRNGSRASQNSHGFRLINQPHPTNDDTSSVHSIYKQKIDAMFESDSNTTTTTKNIVQANIEKMFNDVAQDNGFPLDDIGVHSFSVDYLGSVPLQEKVTSLTGLQGPLRHLYFGYKKAMRQKKTLTGRLEISSGGLKVQYQGQKGDLEQLNSFPTIAVWSAVKFVINGSPKFTYAFLPLITDPDNMDKQTLFRTLDENEKKFITTEAHSPLFAVVMRKIGVHKQLECHGFVCQTSEDAIVIAATLYKSLVAHMKAKERRPKNRNGVTTCMSVASSLNKEYKSGSIPVRPPRKKRSSTTSSVISANDAISISDTKPLLDPYNKPPKKSSKARRAPEAPEPKCEDLNAILPYEEPIDFSHIRSTTDDQNQPQNTIAQEEVKEIKPKTFTDKLNNCMSKEQKQLTAEIKQMMSDGGTKCLKKVQSVRKKDETLRKKEKSGDILTKVTIPRSGSFLNAGGLTKYKNKASRLNEQGNGGSPLGFKEIFNELSLQEGLHSLDDILSVIIDPDGMSFNDLKPIYKEFLLKLSMTLTKDELYQKTKTIMRRQKKKLVRRSPRHKHKFLVGGKFKRLKHIFQKNLKMRFNHKLKQASAKADSETPPQTDSKPPESSISTSSYDTRQFRPKDQNAIKKQGYRKKNGVGRDRTSTSEESDFFSLKKPKARLNNQQNFQNHNKNSSSGYVSCSECSYDSDTCTCTSADKCYCSLGQKHYSRHKSCRNTLCRHEDLCPSLLDSSVTYCECDTDSCAESNKCYCPTFDKPLTITEQLQQRGFTADVDHHRHKKLCKKSSNSKSTKSMEYILNPQESYYDKLSRNRFGTQNSMPLIGRDSDRPYFGNGSIKGFHNFHGRTAFSKAFCENSFGQCRPVSVKSYGISRTQNQSKMQSTISSGACTEALSVKKSAEIAALFTDIKLSQTTDIAQLSTFISSRNSHNKLSTRSRYTDPPRAPSNNLDYSHHQKNVCPNKNGLQNQFRSGTNQIRSGTNSVRSASSAQNQKTNMYSTKNGLYTIQSQSDESRRSSTTDDRKFEGSHKDYFNLPPHLEMDDKRAKLVSCNIENSLGYLP
ncbi:unnamed protein product [Phaedon cochleariae]|uniref:PID domain-containing protein n=1 Tax=Phaedon cochleariae TaxID=80249 RepID=A0A9N9SKD5_PHACE|nr:unnamed protein product [Phaedon cochleariae]